MGLTLGCARCHDHKFDPIRTTDYYALAGIFKSTRTMEHYRVVARWNERPLATPDELADRDVRQKAVNEKKAEIEQVVKRANECSSKSFAAAEPDSSPKLPDKPETRYSRAVQERLDGDSAPSWRSSRHGFLGYPAAMAVGDREAVDLRVHIRGNHLTLGQVVPRRFPLILASEPQTPLESDAKRAPRARRVDDAARSSAHGTSDRQPHLALALRRRARPVAGQFRQARRASDPSRAARLARDAAGRRRLVAQGLAPADPALVDLPDEHGVRPEVSHDRSRQSPALADESPAT